MKSFVFWMLLASALGFVKLFILAYIMPVSEYGQYIAYFGVAALSATLMSMGLIEKTIKAYPRQWLAGQRQVILVDAFRIACVITKRFLFAASLGVVLSYSQVMQVTVSTVILTAGLGLFTSYLALLASLYRAAGSPKALQHFSWWRSLATLCAVAPAGGVGGWEGALAGEMVANFIGMQIGVRQLRVIYLKECITSNASLPNPEVGNEDCADRGHQQLYLANLAALVVAMLDKAWINLAVGAALAGTYGVVMLVPQVAQLLVNVVVQHIGPLIIKMAHLKHKDNTRISAVGLQAGLLAIFALFLTLGALVAKRLPYVDYFFLKFSISDLSLLIAGLIAAGQIYSVLEFHLIACNREGDVLRASVCSGVIFLALFSVATMSHADIEWFFAAMAASRWSQLWLLRAAYVRYV